MSEENDVIKVVPPEEVLKAKPAPKYDFSAFLKPGEDNSKTQPAFEPGRAQGTGLCDGVIYLTGRQSPKDQSWIHPDQFKEALRYIQPQSIEWLALNPGFVGRSKPDVDAILALPHNAPALKQLLDICEETGQGKSCMFKTCKRAVEATRPENIGHWHVVKAPETEGIWCVIWV